jgi:hypothetical protein
MCRVSLREAEMRTEKPYRSGGLMSLLASRIVLDRGSRRRADTRAESGTIRSGFRIKEGS